MALYPPTRFCGSFMLYKGTPRGGSHSFSAGVSGNAKQRRKMIRQWKSSGFMVKQFVEDHRCGMSSFYATKER